MNPPALTDQEIEALSDAAIAAYLSKRNRKAGQASSWNKAIAARKNGKKPPKPGSRPRGRPKKTLDSPPAKA